MVTKNTLLITFLLYIVEVRCETALSPPQDVHVDKGELVWTPVPGENNLTYTVHRTNTSDSKQTWQPIPACVRTPLTSCNVSFTTTEPTCVSLKLRAERPGAASKFIDACSRNASRCTPEVNVTAQPGYLTIHLTRTGVDLVEHHGSHVKYRILSGKEGEDLKVYKDVFSSVSIRDLKEGDRHCVAVQFTVFQEPVGLRSCSRCVTIPSPKTYSLEIALGTLAFFMIVGSTLLIILRLYSPNIKRWLNPPVRIRTDLYQFPPSPLTVNQPDEDNIDSISKIVALEPDEGNVSPPSQRVSPAPSPVFNVQDSYYRPRERFDYDMF